MGLLLDLLLGAGAQQKPKKRPSWESNSDMFADREFIDYRDKWGSNNDHNWEADGDTRWDSYDD